MTIRKHCVHWALTLAALAGAGAANAAPYFEVLPDNLLTQVIQDPVATGNVIPAGALGLDGKAQALSIWLRDPGHAGETRTIRFDYIGSDAGFTNQFSAAAGALRWCNQDAARCGAYSALGAGALDWFGSFAASAFVTAVVDELIDFNFVADALAEGGAPTTFIANGSTSAHAHFAVYDLTQGFDFTHRATTGTVFAIGLSDGGYAGVTELDDDHQDFMLRLSLVDEPSSLTLLGLALPALLLARRSRIRPPGHARSGR